MCLHQYVPRGFRSGIELVPRSWYIDQGHNGHAGRAHGTPRGKILSATVTFTLAWMPLNVVLVVVWEGGWSGDKRLLFPAEWGTWVELGPVKRGPPSGCTDPTL